MWGEAHRTTSNVQPVFAHNPQTSPTMVHELPNYIVVDQSLPPPRRPMPDDIVSPPPSLLPKIYIQRGPDGIPALALVRPSLRGRVGEEHFLSGKRLQQFWYNQRPYFVP